MNARKVFMLFIAVAVIMGAIYFLARYYQACLACVDFKRFSPETIRQYMKGFGAWAIFVYVFFYVLNTFSPFFPPIFIMSLSAGALFGPVMGTVALTLGTLSGTTAAFFAARYLGRNRVENLIKSKTKSADIYEKLSRNGFFILLPMRLIGFPPYGIIDFICGLSKMTYRDFFLATLIGAAPWIVTQVLLADRFTRFNLKDPVLWSLLVLFVGMTVITGKIVKNKETTGTMTGPKG